INGRIWCLQNDRIFPTGTTVVAVERDFYKLETLTTADVDLIRSLFTDSHPAAKDSFNQLLELSTAPFRLAQWAINQSNHNVITEALEEYASNVLEDYHANIEASFLPMLELALKGDISFYDDERCIPFLNFLSTQYMRTKGIKARSIALSAANGHPDLSRAWNVMIHMFATNIGADLYRDWKHRRLVLIHNATDVPFITGDQPAINLKATPHLPPENLSIFYPITPQLALVLADVGEPPLFPENGLTSEQASMLNRKVGEASYQQVFAKERDSLTTMCK
ncbi:MAG: DUF4238 domain-containing protein, partial [Burkholderiaceae bacterium]